MVWQRIASAVVAAPILIVAVWLGGGVFLALIALVVLGAAFEFYAMVGKAGYQPLTALGLFFSLLFVLIAPLGQELTTPLVAVAVFFSLIGLLWRPQFGGAVSDWAITLGGIIYVGLLLSFFVSLRALPQGLGWTALAALGTFASDTGAFAAGSIWGRHKLIPRVSPGKTVEGSIGGLISAIVVAAVVIWAFALPVGWLAALGLGALLGVFAQVGDLAESMIKRGLQVKDASHLIPGHGGLLDRVDSLGFAVVVVYCWAMWVRL